MSVYAYTVWLPVLLAFGIGCGRMVTSNRVRCLAASLAIAAGSILIEINGLTLVEYARGLIAEPSVGLALLCILFMGRSTLGNRLSPESSRLLLTCVPALGICLYPMALGLGWFDPYALGYRPLFAVAVLVLAFLLWWIPAAWPLALWITASLFGHNWHLGESENLWDYLLDPVAFFIGLCWATLRCARTIGGIIGAN